jgi:hypothetical protein
MTITNSPTASGSSFTLDMGQDSATTNKVQKIALTEPAGGTFIIPAQDGVDATGVTPPAGAIGIRGWLSSIWSKLNASIAVTGTFFQATQPVSVASLPLPSGAATGTTPVAAIRSVALESGHIFKSSAGSLLDAYCVTTSVGGFYMLFDQTTVPADGAVTPHVFVNVGAGASGSIAYPTYFPLSFTSGLVGVFSSTGPFTKTASATAFLSARVL